MHRSRVIPSEQSWRTEILSTKGPRGAGFIDGTQASESQVWPWVTR